MDHIHDKQECLHLHLHTLDPMTLTEHRQRYDGARAMPRTAPYQTEPHVHAATYGCYHTPAPASHLIAQEFQNADACTPPANRYGCAKTLAAPAPTCCVLSVACMRATLHRTQQTCHPRSKRISCQAPQWQHNSRDSRRCSHPSCSCKAPYCQA